MSVLRRTLVLSGVLVLAAAGCGSNSLEGGSTSAPTSAPSSAPSSGGPDLSGSLPPKIKSAGKIVVGVDASYPPNEFLAGRQDRRRHGRRPVQRGGAEVRRHGRLAAGRVRHDHHRCPGRQVRRRRLVVHDQRQAQAQVNMVSYFNAGTLWATAKGNPKGVNPDDACGKTVAVAEGYDATRGRPARSGRPSARPTASRRSSSGPGQAGPGDRGPGRRQGRRDAGRLPRRAVRDQPDQRCSSRSSATSTTRRRTATWSRRRRPQFAQAIVEALKAMNADGTYKSSAGQVEQRLGRDHRLRREPVS